MMLELGMYGEIIELNEIIDAIIPLLKQNFFVIDKSKSSMDYNTFSRLDCYASSEADDGERYRSGRSDISREESQPF